MIKIVAMLQDNSEPKTLTLGENNDEFDVFDFLTIFINIWNSSSAESSEAKEYTDYTNLPLLTKSSAIPIPFERIATY